MPTPEDVREAFSPGASNPPQALNWAATTTIKWAEEVQSEWKREQRRQTSQRHRASKKKQQIQLHQDRKALELQLRLHLAACNRAEAPRQENAFKDNYETANAMCRLAIEGGMLREENKQLCRVIQQHELLVATASRVPSQPTVSYQDKVKPQDIYEASKNSRWIRYARQNQAGWQVFFPNEEPSFHFIPFARAEFEDVVENCVVNTAKSSSEAATVGTIFGWNVHHAPLTQSSGDGSLIAHARFTSRMGCSLDEADAAVCGTDINSWSLLFTPTNWTSAQRNTASTQLLQQFDLNSHVLVTNIAGQVHRRYFHFDLRRPHTMASGKRAVWIIASVVDLESTLRHGVDEFPRNDVKWVGDGAIALNYQR